MKTLGFREAAVVMTISAVMSASGQGVRFERVQPDLFASGGSFVNAWADFDGDGDLDQFVGFDGAPNRLYRNDGTRFEDVAAAVAVGDARPTRAAAWGDVDNDADPDLLVGFTPIEGASVLRFYRNNGGTFRDETQAAGLFITAGAVRQPVWVDYDADRDLDLFVAFRDKPNALFRNDSGRFTDVAPNVGLADARRTVGAVWFDHDEDGDLDVIVGNMDGDANGLFSQDNGTFVDVAERAGVAWGGRTANDKSNGTVRPCVADVNNDHHLDVFFANYGKNGLFLSDGRGNFRDVSAAWRIDVDARYDSCAFADFDNDDRLDLYVNGTVTGGKQYADYLMRNTGEAFEDITPADVGSPNSDHGAQWVDYDSDGHIDLSLTGVQKDGMHWLLRNVPHSGRREGLNLRIVQTDGRPLMPGTTVELRLAGSRGRSHLHTRLVDAGSGYNSQSSMPLHVPRPDTTKSVFQIVVRGAGDRPQSYTETVDLGNWKGRVYEIRLRP